MAFEGFRQADFRIMRLPGFEVRMPAIRATVTPKLKELGERVVVPLRKATGLEFFPRVAQHMRRTVNPPTETWVAFSRSPRAYKPFVHMRAAINKDAVKIVCNVDYEAEDLPTFAAGLAQNAVSISAHLAEHPEITCYNLRDSEGAPLAGAALTPELLTGLAARMDNLKQEHIHWAIHIDKTDPVLKTPTKLVKRAVDGMVALLPIYRLGI